MNHESIRRIEFDTQSVDSYKKAAKFMVKVADQCFGIQLPPSVVVCWENTLELMYYTDHVLDHIGSPQERTRFGFYAIECMFADPLDWEYLKFDSPNLDRALEAFRKNLLNINFGTNTADSTLELFEQTESLKQQLSIRGLTNATKIEGQKCAQVLMQMGNNLNNFMGRDKFDKWFERFWVFGNLADTCIDYGDDVKDGLIQTKNNIGNRFYLGIRTVMELFALLRMSNPWLIANYLKAGKYLIGDMQAKTNIVSPKVGLVLVPTKLSHASD